MRVAVASIFRALSSMAMATVVAGTVAAASGAGCSSSSNALGTGGSGGSMATGAGGNHGTGGALGGLGGFQGGAGGNGTDAGAGDGGPGGVSTGAGGSSGLGGAIGGCHAALAAVSPPDLGKLEVFRNAHARVSASASGARSTPVSFAWEVLWQGPNGTVHVDTTPADVAQTVVDFPVDNEGDYHVTARVVGELTCADSKTAHAQRAVFSLRATARDFPVQEFALNLRTGDTPPVAVALDRGVTVSFAPRQAGGAALPGYARVSSPAADWAIQGDTFRGPLVTQLLSAPSYDVLVIPDDKLPLAPLLVSGPPATWQGLVVDAGIPLRATVRDGGNRLLAGARMILRRGALPSTVGTSDASGTMQLWARPGTLTALVLPPDASGLAQASVGIDGAPGIVLGDVAAMDLQMIWDLVTTAPLTVEVHGSDGATPIAGAQVRATSRVTAGAPPATVGRLVTRVGTTSVTLPAVGSIDITATTDAGGVATFTALPVGDLTLLVVPPVGADGNVPSSTAITSVPLTLARGALPQAVTLAKKVALSGVLMPASAAAGAIVTGVDASISAPGRVVTTTVGADGRYTLMVDPGRSYQLIVDPLAGATVARAMLPAATAGTGDTTVPPQTLPAGHPVTGIVTAPDNQVGGVRLEVFCPAWSSQCPNPSFALDTTVTDANGRFQLRLPEPLPQ